MAIAKRDVRALLAAVKTGVISVEDAEKAMEPQNGSISFRVSKEKKALSVYGLQRNPVTLYAHQWARLIAEVSALRSFIRSHSGPGELQYRTPEEQSATLAIVSDDTDALVAKVTAQQAPAPQAKKAKAA